ncbi:DUF2252 domain-containing protein [Zoogloea sp.]|uniref:DUF2252 domain-containing protein n=1 Tax=Zoogloea sp. TaxID=49181 RepID=UPI0035B183B4
MSDVVEQILGFNAGRDPDRLVLKYRNMRASAFVFLRGTCHLFYRRLPDSPLFSSAPPVWSCGDLHLQNFGSYKGDNRLVYFDLNDFDESALAPASWDLVRFLTSLQIGAAAMEVKKKQAGELCDEFLDAYRATLVAGKAGWVERDTASGLVRHLLDGLHGRLRPAFLDGRTELKGKRRHLRLDNGKALPVTDKQRDKVTKLIGELAESQADPHFYEVLDVARRIAGNGSLGVDRFVILVRGKGSPDGNYLVDLKEALPSSLVPYLKTPQPAWKSEAARVVTVQRRMQAVSMAFLQPVKMGKRSYILRGLQPTEDRVVLEESRSGFDAIRGVVGTMGAIVASAQLRSSGRSGSAIADALIDFGAGKWRKALLAAADECSDRLRKDWKTYCEAYDDGAFPVGAD